MRRVIRYGIAVVVGLVILGAPGRSVSAAEQKVCPICSKAADENASYPVKAGSVLVRGATNTLLGWTELIRQPVQEAKAGGNVLTGVAHGIGYGVTRTLAGVGEVLTFWTPKTKNGYIHFAKDCPLCEGK